MSWWHGDQMAGMWILWTLAFVLMVLASWFVARGWTEADRISQPDEPLKGRRATGDGRRDE
jgi:hypothetical protein